MQGAQLLRGQYPSPGGLRVETAHPRGHHEHGRRNAKTPEERRQSRVVVRESVVKSQRGGARGRTLLGESRLLAQGQEPVPPPAQSSAVTLQVPWTNEQNRT